MAQDTSLVLMAFQEYGSTRYLPGGNDDEEIQQRDIRLMLMASQEEDSGRHLPGG